MKKSSRQKLIFLLVIILSLLSVLSYINLNKIESSSNYDTDHESVALNFENLYLFATSNELDYIWTNENDKKSQFSIYLEDLSRSCKDFGFLFIATINFSLDLFLLLKFFSNKGASREKVSKQKELEKLTEIEKKIYIIIQEYLNNNRVFDKETVAIYIKSRYAGNGNLNHNGIQIVIESLLKKNLIVEGSKLTRDSILLNLNRNKIYNLIKENPGSYKNFLTEKLNLSPYLIKWHLKMLINFQLIRERNFDGHVCYFDFSLNAKNDQIYQILSKDTCMRIIEFLIKNNQGCTKYRIAKVLHMHYNTINKYLNKLEEFNLIIRMKYENRSYLFLDEINFKKIINQDKN